MKQLVLVRHGESAWNVEHRIQGQLGTGLSERGHRQAKATADLLAESFPDALLYVSDLQRCRETAAPLEAALGRDATPMQALRERDYGDWSGRLADEVRTSEPDRWARWRAGADIVGEIGGESTAVFTERVAGAMRRLVEEAPDGAIVVCVTHGGPVWHGTRALLDLHEEALGGVANASVTEIAFADAFGRRLVAWNQVSHLPVDLRTFLRRVEPARRSDRDDDALEDAAREGSA